MTTPVIITLIICCTLVALCLVGTFGKGGRNAHYCIGKRGRNACFCIRKGGKMFNAY